MFLYSSVFVLYFDSCAFLSQAHIKIENTDEIDLLLMSARVAGVGQPRQAGLDMLAATASRQLTSFWYQQLGPIRIPTPDPTGSSSAHVAASLLLSSR